MESTIFEQVMCQECGREPGFLIGNDFRYVFHENRFSGKRKYTGPYDRLCAYKRIYGSSLTYRSYPDSKRELLYRLLTRRELPKNKVLVNIYLLRLLLSLLLTIGYFFHSLVTC